MGKQRMKLSEEVKAKASSIYPCFIRTDWLFKLSDRIASIESELADAKAENERLRNGLQLLSSGDTEWVDGYHTEGWEVMAEYAKKLLEEK